jgi:peroxiredoxin
MRDDLAPGNVFPEFTLPDNTGRDRTLGSLANGRPLVLCFVRGWWCPKEQVRVRTLVALQEELQRETARIAVVTVDEPYVNGAFRAGIGAAFPFLSDENRELARDLELLELTDAKHLPYLPTTFVLDSQQRIEACWTGFWTVGNATPEELRQALRAIVRREQPSFDPHRTWASSPDAAAGIDAPAVWVREDGEARELERGAVRGPTPEVGARHSVSVVDGRPWIVQAVEKDDGRTLLRLRKSGAPKQGRAVGHSITAPRCF